MAEEQHNDQPKKRRRGPGRPFMPGQSGNPGGRPKVVAELRDLARAHSAAAIDKLAQLMQSARDERVQAQAAAMLLDRAWGRPAQTIPDDGMETDSATVRARLIKKIEAFEVTGLVVLPREEENDEAEARWFSAPDPHARMQGV